MPPEKMGGLREQEEINSARQVGVLTIEFWNYAAASSNMDNFKT